MAKEFVDYYELLEISPNANTDVIEKVFRFMAARVHPDATKNGDPTRFNELVQAYKVLKEPESRAAFDIEYQRHLQNKQDLIDNSETAEEDSNFRHRILTLFYAQRKRDMKNPGLGSMKLAEILGCPLEFLDFNLWYFMEKEWIHREENGQLAITAEGVDEIERRVEACVPSNRMLTDQSSTSESDRLGPPTFRHTTEKPSCETQLA